MARAAPACPARIDPAPPCETDPILEETNHPPFSAVNLKWSAAALIMVLVGCSGLYQWWNTAPGTPPLVATVVLAAPPVQEQPRAPEQAPVQAQAPVQTQVRTRAPAAEGPADLELSATELTWLSVTSNGHQIFSGVLQASESKTLSGVRTATVKIGNAGGVEIRWKGAALGPLGGRGEVRTVLLTPDKFEILDSAKQL